MSTDPLSIRLPREVRVSLTAAAAEERRSVSSMCRILLEDALAARHRDAAADQLRRLGYRFRDGR